MNKRDKFAPCSKFIHEYMNKNGEPPTYGEVWDAAVANDERVLALVEALEKVEHLLPSELEATPLEDVICEALAKHKAALEKEITTTHSNGDDT